jgi:hypothetical protein
MRASITLLALVVTLANANILAPRQSASASASASVNQEYINSVCSPNVTSSSTSPRPAETLFWNRLNLKRRLRLHFDELAAHYIDHVLNESTLY